MSLTFANNNAAYETPDELFQDVSTNASALAALCAYAFSVEAEVEEVAEATVPLQTTTTTTVTIEPVVDPSAPQETPIQE